MQANIVIVDVGFNDSLNDDDRECIKYCLIYYKKV